MLTRLLLGWLRVLGGPIGMVVVLLRPLPHQKEVCMIPPVGSYSYYKFTKLSESYLAVMDADLIDAHDALVDTQA